MSDRQLQLFGGFTAPAAEKFKPPVADRADRNRKVARELRDIDALFGRTTYYAGPSQARYSAYPGTGITPEQIWHLQLLRNTGYPQLWVELSEQTIERDGHLGGIMDSRRSSVSDKDFRIHPAKRGDDLAELIARTTERAIGKMDDFDQTVEDLLSAPAYGYAISEIVWAWDRLRVPTDSGRRHFSIDVKLPRRIDWVHWKHVRFDRYTDEPYLWIGSGGDYSFPPHKFIFHSASGTGLFEKRGFMGSCNWLSSAKRWTERDWLVYAKIFGIPQIIAQYPDGIEEYDAHRAKYVQFLKDWGEGIPALLPDDLKLNITRDAGGRSGDLHGSIIGWANAEMSKRVLGSTLTVEMGGQGSWAAADTHRDAPYIRSRADSRKLAGTLRRDLFRAFVEENILQLAAAFGEHPEEILGVVPRCSWRIEREMAPKERHDIFAGAVNDLGLEVDEDQYREEMALDAPRPGGRKLKGKLEAIGKGGALIPTAEAAQVDEPLTVAGEGELPPEETTAREEAAREQARPAPSPAAMRALRSFASTLPGEQRHDVTAFLDAL